MTKINLEYCGMCGSGRTVKEAKQDAARKIQFLIDDLATPMFIRWRDAAVLISRNVGGWQYSIVHALQTSDFTTGLDMHGSCCGFDSRPACEKAARLHLADMERKPGDGVPEIIRTSRLSGRDQADMEREYLERAARSDRQYTRAREAQTMGLNGTDAMAYILEDPRFVMPARA